MIHLKFAITLLFSCLTLYGSSQKTGWTKDEELYYKTVNDLCNYLRDNKYDTTKRDFIFKNYVYFAYVLNDTSTKRVKSRIAYFDGLFPGFQHFIDSVGVTNLDAKPVRFFKSDSEFYEPFTEEIKDLDSMTLAYYDIRRPTKPLGALLFEQKTHKLASWILINQGGTYYFLTFNLVDKE